MVYKDTQKPKIIAIVGSTSSGKTALSLEIAQMINSEIISADSRQVYQGMDIGTGKITTSEMNGIPHHLISVAHPAHVFSVAEFQKMGTDAINTILEQGKTPIVAGGTGMYITTLLEGITYPEVPPNETLRKELESKPTEELFTLLQQHDPVRAGTIDKDNQRRLIRALEIIDAIGAVPAATTNPAYNILWIGLELPKERLQQKIRERIDTMIQQGLIAEVETLLDPKGPYKLDHGRLQALGLEYRHVSDYLQGKYENIESMIDGLATKTWQYAKRQMTWFKRNDNIVWFNPETDKEKILQQVKDFVV